MSTALLESDSRIDTSLYCGRAFVYLDRDQYELALQDFDRAIQLQRLEIAWTYCGRGVAYAGLGQHGRALQDFDRALQFEPADALAYFHRGLAYFGLGQHERALQDFHRAVQLQSEDPAASGSEGGAEVVLEGLLTELLDRSGFVGSSPEKDQRIETWGEETSHE